MRGYNNDENPTPKGMRLWFTIFMILIYVGMGLLFIFDFFIIGKPAVNYTVGGLLILYGIYRGYRLYVGSK